LSRDPVQTDSETKSKPGSQFTIYLDANQNTVCRAATSGERKEMDAVDPETLGLRPINHLRTIDKTQGIQTADAAPNLTIVLQATPQLQQNAAATAAFTRAAQNWEAIIKSPITIYIDVDYGSTRFGQPWPSGVLGSTSTPSGSYPFQSVRSNLIAEANGEGNVTKQAIFTALPSNTVPTDIGEASSTDVADSNARAIGLLPATAQPTDSAARIAFNSSSTFDFDPSDGITAGVDFDAVATHEIGHALGFNSDAGLDIAKPTVWDLYRFRTGVTDSTFTAAQRILTVGGSPNPLQFFFVPGNMELGLSTGGPIGNGGDGFQSSHWKHMTGCIDTVTVTYIGIMDPAIPSGCRRIITDSDKLALTSFGYNLTNNNPPPPPPPPPPAPANDNFASAQAITGCTGSTTGTNFGATKESGEPSHDPDDSSSLSPGHTVWYQWQAPSTGSVNITTAGSDFDTIIAVYTGNTVNGLTRLIFNDDVQLGVIVTSSVTFDATAGTIYRIAIDGWGGDQGMIRLNWTGCGNPIDVPNFFVKQHYLDFLNRQPDQAGWDFWTNKITSCGANAQCIEVQRISVSASFFLSIEFQQTGYLVERFYKVAYGDATGNSTINGPHQLSVPIVRFNEFLQDTQRIGQGVIVLQPGWDTLLENNKQAYAKEFVQTSRFTAAGAFPTTMTPTQFVDKLDQNAGHVLSASERTTIINLFGGSVDTSSVVARAQAIRQVAEDQDLYNAELNRAFVLAEYFGYLRRNPNDSPESTLDYSGYDFWLTKLNQFNGNYFNAEMVKAFLSSIEYRQRFGP